MTNPYANAYAVAAVTKVLKHLLEEGVLGLNSVIDPVDVSALAPDRISGSGSTEPTRLNIFLYQTAPNQGWRNVGLPSHNPGGHQIDHNPLALNLYYLVTAFGADSYFPEVLLGHAMQWLHDNGTLMREKIRSLLAVPDPISGNLSQKLKESRLAEQIEQIRITPQHLNTEELSRLWSAIQSHMRPTATYQVSVLLISEDHSFPRPLPVRKPCIYAMPLTRPFIEQITSTDDRPITIDKILHITGRSLKAGITQIMVDKIDMTSQATEIGDTRITLEFSPPPPGLFAGVRSVQVIHQLKMGPANTAHRIFASNAAPFVLHPEIEVSDPSGTSSSVEDGEIVISGEISVKFKPNVGEHQNVVLYLNEYDPPDDRAARAYSFSAPAGGADADEITIPFEKVIKGAYLVRLQVDGAESALELDGTTKMFENPKLNIE